MTMRRITFSVEGVGQEMLQHNPRLSNFMDPYAKAVKHLTEEGKKKGANKEEIFIKLFRQEWEGGLYHSEVEGGLKDGLGPYVPGKHFRASVWDAAKQYKQGKTVSGAVFIDENSVRCPLEFDFKGDKADLDALYNSGRFADTQPAKVNGKMILRTRPCFPTWKTSVTFLYDSSAIQREALEKFMREAAMRRGIGDGRNQGYGRFKVTNVVDEPLKG